MIEYKDREFYNAKDLALAIIGGKWKVPIVWFLLHEQPLRLSEFCRRMPDTSQRMIIKQLRELEDDGIIARKVYPVVPPKVDYRLTAIGQDLAPVVAAICDWGDQYVAAKGLTIKEAEE